MYCEDCKYISTGSKCLKCGKEEIKKGIFTDNEKTIIRMKEDINKMLIVIQALTPEYSEGSKLMNEWLDKYTHKIGSFKEDKQ